MMTGHMTAGTYSRDHIADVLTKVKLPTCYRIIPRRLLDTPLGAAPADSRFCSKAHGHAVLYTTPDFATAFIEVIVRDRFTRKRQREILLKEVTERAWIQAATKPRSALNLLDLRNDGCVRLGAPTDAVNARSHAAGRSLSRIIHDEHKNIDGFLFASRLTGADIYAVFDRAIDKLDVEDSGDLVNHPELPDVLRHHKISLIVHE